MMIKIGMFVMFLALLSATTGFNTPKHCDVENLGNGEVVETCGDGKEMNVTKNGKPEMTIIFQNNTLEIFQFPNSKDCYIVHNIELPEGISGELTKRQCYEKVNDSLSSEVKSLLPAKCTGTVSALTDCPAQSEEAARHKRACLYYFDCKYYNYYYRYYGIWFVRRIILCYLKKTCF